MEIHCTFASHFAPTILELGPQLLLPPLPATQHLHLSSPKSKRWRYGFVPPVFLSAFLL
ncbi:hypothetical protein I3842_13G131800 [Carya illinoinensis]|uniref:Uncharacterized protein n=1 Tax=Carya illinoinensis TaxID=32201 RepID=A0A922AII4_CARIL|nr:hypothetical protein I3842_13G131800 [Carya illinoinensis]